MDIFLPEFKQILLLLKKHNVNFMLIGGYAVIYYGYGRFTRDLDIWLEPENLNRDNLVNALKEYGVGTGSLDKIKQLDFSQVQFFYFGKEPKRIDFLTKITGVSYIEAAPQVELLPLDNEQIPVIHFHHLILSKISNNRLQDKADVEELQKIAKYKKNNL